jgi:arylsulfatase A-like enzyme
MRDHDSAIWALLLIALALLVPTDSMAQAVERPNILILFSDDQRADAVGAHGNPYIHTPHLDALAERGVSFRQAYVMGSHHGAVCAPSRAMLMTGRNLFRVYDNLDSLDTMPQRLREVGYETFGTGKWHQSRESFAKSFGNGKNIFFGGMNDHYQTAMTDLMEDGTFSEPESKGFSTTHFADAVIDFLKTHATRAGDHPFLAYVAFTAPHDPRSPPQEFIDMYGGDGVPLPPNFMSVHPFDLAPMSMTVRDEHLAPWPRPPEMIRSQIAEYYGLITHLDREIGRIMATLDETGLRKNTVVIFAADNGLGLGSHGMMGKQSLYEHSTHVPLIVAGPGIPHGESESLTYLYDITPTVLNLAGASLLPRMDGADLSPVWRGDRTANRETLFTAFFDTQRAVRDGRYKLIRYPRIHHTQLFDLRSDPYELHNLAEDVAYQERVDDMMQLLRKWQREMGDPQPLTAAHRESMEFDYSHIERRPDRWQPEWIREKYFGEEKD